MIKALVSPTRQQCLDHQRVVAGRGVQDAGEAGPALAALVRRALLCNSNYMNTAHEAAGQDAAAKLRGWFRGRLPDAWFETEPEIAVDREEITIIGRLPGPGVTDQGVTGAGVSSPAATAGGAASAGADSGAAGESAASRESAASGPEAAAAALGRARRFREETRDARIEIAREVEHTFGRKVSWGVRCGDEKVMFTTLSVPVMTRLRQPERRVLDTLVEAGVARSRSDALAWCVRLVGEHEEAWLGELREALQRVEQVRAAGPQA